MPLKRLCIQQIITGLLNDILTLEKELILVLDDYHAIELPAIHDNLNYLLDHLPPNMGLVVITRSDPPLNLARRRVAGRCSSFALPICVSRPLKPPPS